MRMCFLTGARTVCRLDFSLVVAVDLLVVDVVLTLAANIEEADPDVYWPRGRSISARRRPASMRATNVKPDTLGNAKRPDVSM